MKLIFSRGEHAPVSLADGVTRIGSAADCEVRIEETGIAPHHAKIDVNGDVATLVALAGDAATVLNGRQITQPTELTTGDLVLFGRVGCSVVSGSKASAPLTPADNGLATDPAGHTVMRMAMPRFILRGVSGITFGKTFVMTGTMTIGRQNDCDIHVPADEVSRRHARLVARPVGVSVEDLGSANGTFINDKRIQTGMLTPGDELRLDSVRFQLSVPGSAAPPARPPAEDPAVDAAPTAPAGGSNFALWLSIGIIVAALIGAAALHYAGYF